MSALTEELDPKVVRSWRAFAETPHFQLGIDWLRHNRAPKVGGTEAEMLKNSLSWSAYMQALEDIQDTLTNIPKKEDSLDEKPLNSP